MAKKLKFGENLHPADREMADFNFRQLQGACIEKGMPFDEVVKADHGKLASFFKRAYDNSSRKSRLREFDNWVDSQLKSKYDENHPIRQFKRFTIEEKPIQEKPIKQPKEIKIKKEKDKRFNIFKGTKKEYTYSLVHKLYEQFGKKYDKKKLINKFSSQLSNKVINKFPEAKEKSIKIWMKRCLDAII